MLPYQRRSGSSSPRTSEIEVPRPPTRPIPIPRVASERPSAAPALHPAVPEVRPEFPLPHGDEELTVMMPSKSAAALPPPPDPRAARIPRQWSPVGQVVSSVHSSAGAAQPTLPSLSIPPRSSVPTPPSSLAGIAFNDSTARVRTGALGKIARPTLSWAAALVALGIFVGIGSAVVSRNDVLRGKGNASAGEPKDKNDKADKKSPLAKTAPASSTKLTSATPPPPLVSAAAAPPPPPLPAAAPPSPVGEVAANTLVQPALVNPAHDAPAVAPAAPVAGQAAAAQAVAAARPNLPNDPANANAALTPSPGVGGQAPLAQATPRPRPAAPAPRPARAPVARAEEEAPAPPAPTNTKAAAKKKEADLSKQAADLAAEQLGSLL